jgi:lysophospholipase L1-like esterase
VILLGPPLLLLLILELALQWLLPRERRSFATRLAASQEAEVTNVPGGNFMGMIAPSALPETGYQLKPHRRWTFMGVDVRTNGQGFRGAEFAEQKPPGTRRVVGLGDSVMFGWGVREEATYMARLQAALARRQDLGRIEVLNCAVPGFNAPQEAALLRHRCAAYAPDLIVVGYTLNDGDPPLFQDPPSDGILEESRLFTLGRDLWRLRFPPPTQEVQRLRRIRRGLEGIARLAGDRGAPVAFLIYPQHLNQYDAEVPRRLAVDLGFRYVDLYSSFESAYRERRLAGIEDLYLSAHDAHPNEEGHEMIAASLEPVVAALLEGQ